MHKFLFFLFLPFVALAEETDIPIKLYCFYTPQFQSIYERYFLPSIQDSLTVVCKEFPQDCPTSLFKSPGWEKTMLHKLEFLIEAIQENWNRVFLYSDIDLIFLKPALETILFHLQGRDFVIQQGWPSTGICAGFFAMRGNERTLKWFSQAHDLFQKGICSDDQTALQLALRKFLTNDLSWTFLPSEQFSNGRKVLKNILENRGMYSKDSEISLDPSIVLFHANCCLGLENKTHFLEKVQKEYNLRLK